MRKVSADSGFTLIELLIAVSILAVIAVSMAIVVGSVTENQQAVDERSLKLAALDNALAVIKKDLEQAVLRPAAFAGGLQDKPAVLTGFASETAHGGELIRFSRFGRQVLPNQQVNRVQAIRYFLDDGKLIRAVANQSQPESVTLMHELLLLDDVTDIELSYLHEDWQQSWGRDEKTMHALPRAIRIVISTALWEEIEQIVLLSGSHADATSS